MKDQFKQLATNKDIYVKFSYGESSGTFDGTFDDENSVLYIEFSGAVSIDEDYELETNGYSLEFSDPYFNATFYNDEEVVYFTDEEVQEIFSEVNFLKY